MNRHEFIDFLKSLNLKNVPLEPNKDDYLSLIKIGVVKAFVGLTEQEKEFAGSFIKMYPHIYYVPCWFEGFTFKLWHNRGCK